MKVALLSWGSLGDLVPFLTLASELVRRGHTVALGGPATFAPHAATAGIDFYTIGTAVDDACYRRVMDHLRAEPNPMRQLQYLQQEVLSSDLDREFADAREILAAADVAVCHWMQIGGMFAVESLGMPLVTVALNPVGLACLYESVGGQGGLARRLADSLWGDGVHEFRQRAGLRAIDSMTAYQYQTGVNLVAVSRHILPESATWPDRHHVIGFLQAELDRQWQPDRRLEDFLSGGDKPIVIGFGSMSGNDAAHTTQILVDAVAEVGCRAILQAGWGKLGAAELPEHILGVGYVPHGWLYERAACVVHHGGAGTTASALAAGVPSVIVWHMLDQPFWGHALARLQLGPKPLARSAMDATSLATLVRAALHDPAYARACAEIGGHVRQECAVQRAVDLIECHAAGVASPAAVVCR